MVKIAPAGHRVLVRVRSVEEKTSGGIIIPSKTKDQLQNSQDIGEVLEVGPTAFEGFGGAEAWGVEPGVTILFARHGGKKVMFDGFNEDEQGDLRIINDEDVVGLVKEVE